MGFFWIETPNIKCYIDNLLCYAAVLAGQAHDHLGEALKPWLENI